jgi:hypothetical protein
VISLGIHLPLWWEKLTFFGPQIVFLSHFHVFGLCTVKDVLNSVILL